MTDPRETLARIRKRADAATEGPWAPWLDQDGAKHMGGLLMVGNAEAVIPDGEEFVDGVDVNPIAHVYVPPDRAFIAHARTDVPALVAALRAVLDVADRHDEDADELEAFVGGPSDEAEHHLAAATRIREAINTALAGEEG